MALQEVVRDYIFLYDSHYLNHFGSRISIEDTNCRSCSKPFKNTFVHAKIRGRGPIKRHLVCAIAHDVINLDEARELAAKSNLEIDWATVQLEVEEYLASRRTHQLAVFSWVMGAIAFIGLVPVVPL